MMAIHTSSQTLISLQGVDKECISRGLLCSRMQSQGPPSKKKKTTSGGLKVPYNPKTSSISSAVALAGRVTLSLRDKAAQISLSPDQMTCMGKGTDIPSVLKFFPHYESSFLSHTEGGYRMVRATHGVHNGLYFWEAEVLPPVGEYV